MYARVCRLTDSHTRGRVVFQVRVWWLRASRFGLSLWSSGSLIASDLGVCARAGRLLIVVVFVRSVV